MEQLGHTDDSWGTLARLLYEFPRPGLPTVKFYWYDGYRWNQNVMDESRWTLVRPPLADELEKKYGEKWPEGGTLFVGDKGIMYCDIFGGNPHIVNPEQHKATPKPAEKYPRIVPTPGMFGSQADFMRACREGKTQPCSNFPNVSGPYIEALLVGDLAMRAGVGKKLEWDGVNMKCTNYPEINQFVKPEYRPGWGL